MLILSMFGAIFYCFWRELQKNEQASLQRRLASHQPTKTPSRTPLRVVASTSKAPTRVAAVPRSSAPSPTNSGLAAASQTLLLTYAAGNDRPLDNTAD